MKPDPFEERCLAAIIGVGSIEQVIRDPVTLHNGLVGIGQFHCGTLPERFVLVPPDLVTIFAVAAAQPARPGRRGDRGAR